MDPKAVIQSAMAILSGRDGPPSGDDYAQAYDAFNAAKNVPFAMAKLAALTAMGCGTAKNINASAALYHQAVLSGFPPLLRDMAVILDGAGGDAGLIRTLLMRAASAGDPVAIDLVRAWKKRQPPVPPKAIDIDAMKAAIESIFQAAPIQKTPSLSDELSVCSYPNALTPMQCDYLIAISNPLLQPSKVVDGSQGADANFRTSDGAVFLPSHMDIPVLQIVTKLAGLTNASPEQGEFLALLRYRPGQEYRPHHDYLPMDADDYGQVKSCGQRRATVLTYLSTGYEGGATQFPVLDLKYCGGQGDSLVFANVDDVGQPLPQSLHAGMPVTGGEKWLVTLWVREKRFWPW